MAGSSRHQAREAAVQALYQWDLTEQDPDEILEHFILQHDLEDADQAYFYCLVREVPLYHQEIRAQIEPFLDRDMDSIDPVERSILRLGAYELEYRPDVPAKVILNEAVELAKTFGADHSYRFVNGVLDKLAHRLRPNGDNQLSRSDSTTQAQPSVQEK